MQELKRNENLVQIDSKTDPQFSTVFNLMIIFIKMQVTHFALQTAIILASIQIM